MRAWGYKALQSDAGLDIVDLMEESFEGKSKIILSEFISSAPGLSPDRPRHKKGNIELNMVCQGTDYGMRK